MVRNKDISKNTNNRKYILDHIIFGLMNMYKPINWIYILIPYIVLKMALNRQIAEEYEFLQKLHEASYTFCCWSVFLFVEFIILVYVIGSPSHSRKIEDGLQSAGFVNHLGVPPYLLSRKINKENNKIIELRFKGNSIPLSKWEDERDTIEQALNITIAKMSYEKGKDVIAVICSKAIGDLPSCIYWNKKMMQKEKSVYVIGECIEGQLKINLDKIPHVIIGGSTGSGKTQLLRFLLMQAIQKKEIVYIADLKGGIDYQGSWRTKRILCTDGESVMEILDTLVNELENRKKLLEGTNCHNITEYNSKNNVTIPRIIFACDEIAEILDTTGLNKEDKEIVKNISSKLSTLARLGRAFSINLILATQRPDADIMPGQVKANIDYRIAGRCDEPLSRVLGVPDAHKLVPKDIAGRFMLYDGTLFQGYLFDEEKDLS